MNRKIIQICVAPGYKIQSHVGEFKSPGGVVALCDDGTLWRLPDGNEKYSDAWFRLADIPQPEFVNVQYAQLLKPLDESDF